MKKGDTIGIAAPATHAEGQDITAAVQDLKDHGYKVKLTPTATGTYGFFSGTDEARARDLNALFADDSVKAILCLNGGYGSGRILDKLDYGLIHQHPKLVIGFSDVTALQTALWQKAHLVTANGPLLVTLAGGSPYTRQSFYDGLLKNDWSGPVTLPQGRHLKTLVSGKATGRLVGGNLAMLTSLVGTPYELDGTGDILVLEEVSENSYRIDRMLNQLYQSGLLKRVSAIVYGDFTNCGHDPGDFTTPEVLEYYAKLVHKPVISGLPVGHEWDKVFLPYGIQATVDARADGTASLTLAGNI